MKPSREEKLRLFNVHDNYLTEKSRDLKLIKRLGDRGLVSKETVCCVGGKVKYQLKVINHTVVKVN